MASFDLTISPSQLETVINPGSGISQAFNVTNNSDSVLTLIPLVQPWQPVGSDGSVTYDRVDANPALSFSLMNADIHLGSPFSLAPGQKQQLVLKVAAAPSASLGDSYYTFFLSQDLSSVSTNTTQSQITAKMGTHLLISVSDGLSHPLQVHLDRLSVTPKIKDILLTPLELTGQITNDSDYFTKTVGKITVTKNGRQVREFTLFPSNVLAHHSRSLSCLDPGSGPDSPPHQIACSLNPPFWPGAYNATLSLDPAINARDYTVSFYVFPYTFLAVLLFFGLIAFLIAARLRRR